MCQCLFLHLVSRQLCPFLSESVIHMMCPSLKMLVVFILKHKAHLKKTQVVELHLFSFFLCLKHHITKLQSDIKFYTVSSPLTSSFCHDWLYSKLWSRFPFNLSAASVSYTYNKKWCESRIFKACISMLRFTL